MMRNAMLGALPDAVLEALPRAMHERTDPRTNARDGWDKWISRSFVSYARDSCRHRNQIRVAFEQTAVSATAIALAAIDGLLVGRVIGRRLRRSELTGVTADVNTDPLPREGSEGGLVNKPRAVGSDQLSRLINTQNPLNSPTSRSA